MGSKLLVIAAAASWIVVATCWLTALRVSASQYTLPAVVPHMTAACRTLTLFPLPTLPNPEFAWPKGYSPMTKSTSLTAADRQACCGTALASNATCAPLCLGELLLFPLGLVVHVCTGLCCVECCLF